MTSFGWIQLLDGADTMARRRSSRPRSMLKKKTAAKKLKHGFKNLKLEMQEISNDQQIIKQGQMQVRVKLEAVVAECANMRKETEAIIKQSALNKLKLYLMFKILKAREEGYYLKATQLLQLLRTLTASSQ